MLIPHFVCWFNLLKWYVLGYDCCGCRRLDGDQGEVNGSPAVYYNPIEGYDLEVGYYTFTCNYTESREVSPGA